MKNRLVLNLLVLIFTVLGFSGLGFALDHPRYDLDVTFDSRNHALGVRQKVLFTNQCLPELKEIFFHVYPHRKYTESEKEFMLRFAGYFKTDSYPEGFQSGDLKINNISDDSSHRLNFEYIGKDQSVLKVILARPLARGETLELNLDFQVEIPHAYGRFGWHNDIVALSRWYPLLSVLDKDGWHNYPFYPYHQPFFSDAARYRVNLNLPTGYTVIHSGNLEKKAEDNGRQVLLIDSDVPIREFSLAMSPDYKLVSREFSGVKINSYYLGGNEFYAKKALEFAITLFENYSRKFGRYPYKQFSIAPVYLGYGGNQLSNLIFVDTRAYKLPRFLIRYFDFLIAHETGHQWFYNLVGNDEYKEMWLDEGINSYFILQYLEEKYGKDATVMVLPKYLDSFIPNFTFRRTRDYRYFYLAKHGLDHPVLGELSSFQEPSSIFSITYGKGSRVLDMLHDLVGEAAFKRIFERYFKEYAFKNVKVEDFELIAYEEGRQDLSWFFNEWLLTSKSCDYAVVTVENNRIVLENRGKITMPVETRIDFSDGTQQTDVWDGLSKVHQIDLNSDKQVKQVSVDPKEKILDIDRTNNFWPRKVYKKPVPIYFGAYEIPVVLPEDSYNLVFGPEVANNGPGLKASLQNPFDNIFYLSADYDLGSNTSKSTVGYELKHLFKSQTSLGLEYFKNKDLGGKENDLEGGKIYLRRELWPASYGLAQVNDHISLYLIRDRDFAGTLTTSGLENIGNLSYKKHNEAIIGTTLNLNRSGPYPDPKTGYNIDATIENAEHFLGGRDYFWRGNIDWSGYKSIFKEGKLALRLKYGWGWPTDKNLYQLGGSDGLRGYRLKTVRGSHTMLGSLEYRFPMARDINLRLLDNIINLSGVDVVVFTDAGKSWYQEFGQARFKKDAGLGLRLHVDIGSFLEKVILRLDVAQAIDEPKEKQRVWLGINHSF